MVEGGEIYAIVDTGSKQYKVTPGQVIDVERLPVEKGSRVELNKVLLVVDGEKTLVGQPTVEGAIVVAKALKEDRSNKVIVFKYKPKVRYRRKKGHRQLYTRLAIRQIITG